MDTSVLIQNFFLYFYGACFNLFGLGVTTLMGAVPVAGMFTGISSVAWLLIMNNAMQGILSSFFFKFADTILKKYSSTIATIFTGLLSAALFGHSLTLNFALGVSIVFISMHLFFSMGGTKGNVSKSRGNVARMTLSPSLEHLNLSRVASAGEFLDRASRDNEETITHSLDRNGENLLPR